MINKKFQNLIEDLQSVKMTREEKTDVMHRVFETVGKMESNLVFESKAEEAASSAELLAEKVTRNVKSNFYTVWYQYVGRKQFVPALSMLFILLATGGVSLAAERALPGDSLYSLKVNVNESVKSFAAVTPEAKAKFALEVTDKRLKEAAILSQSGRLDAITGQIIQKQLNKQADQVKFQVASLVSTNNLKSAQEIAINFESSLRAHELILEQISNDRASSSAVQIAQIGNLIFALQSEIATTTIARSNIQAKEVLAVNGEKVALRLGEVKTKLAEIKILAGSSSVSTSTASTTKIYLAEATKLVNFATDRIAKALYPDALTLTQSAFQYITDAEILLATDLTTDGSIRTTAATAMSAATSGLTSLSTTSSELIMSVTLSASLASTTAATASSTASSTEASSGASATSTPAGN